MTVLMNMHAVKNKNTVHVQVQVSESITGALGHKISNKVILRATVQQVSISNYSIIINCTLF